MPPPPRDERHVRHDAAAAAHGPPVIGPKDGERVFRRARFARERQVLLARQSLVTALDDAPARSVDPRDRQLHPVARRQHHEAGEHERLAEAAAPEDQGAVVVLERARQRL